MTKNKSTIEQLTLLGYKNGDKVYYRAIEPEGKSSPRKIQSIFPDIPAKLTELNQTHNIYVVVNGGGDKDADVTEGKSLFYEHDDISKDDQLKLWESLELPEPTFQIDTGGKSIHSYWVFAEPIEVGLWKILQRDLLNYANGDKSIKNPSRVMRLAGYLHQKTGEISTVISRSGKTYRFDKLRSIVPAPKLKQSKPRQPVVKSDGDKLLPIPIKRCLSKSNRESLSSGHIEGSRDNTAIAIARDLIGVAEVVPNLEFDYRGKNYRVDVDGDPYQILCDFSNRCTPSLTDADIDRIWKSASGYPPAPAINDSDALRNCLRSWAKECLPALEKPVKSKKGKQSLDDDTKEHYEDLAAILDIKLEYDEYGDIASRLNKLKMDLFAMFSDRLKLNLMTRDYELDGHQIDINNAKSFIAEKLGWDFSTENCILAIHSISNHHAYHPVDVYLESIRGKVTLDFDVLENLATVFLGNPNPLANKMMAKTLIGSVARVKKPGNKVDTLTVLQGGQGFLKSTFLKVLAGEIWFCDDIRDLENKDELAKLARYWIIELAEVDYLMGRKEVESFKRFLSSTADTYRPPYGRANIRHDRTCSLFATTNKSEFLKDPTGSRRYWVVKVGGKINCDLVAKFRDIIWATALAAYERGDTWWLDDDDEKVREEASEEFREPDAWEETIISKWSKIAIADDKGCERVKIDRIFEILDLDYDKRTKPNRNRIASILKLWGFEHKTINTETGKAKVWLRPKGGGGFGKKDLIPDDTLKNKVLEKYAFLGSNSSIISSTEGFEVEPDLDNLLGNEKDKYPLNGFQPVKNLELNLELNHYNLELNSKNDFPQLELNSLGDNRLEPELSSSSNSVPETVSLLLEPKNLRKRHFEIGQKNNSEEIIDCDEF